MLCGPAGRMSMGREHTRVPAGSARVVWGPCSTISAQNSCPMTTSRLRSMTSGLPDRREFSTNLSACLRAWRSDPQIPQASVLTSTSPDPGCGSGMSATMSARLRMTTARMPGSLPRELERLGVDSGRALRVTHVLAHAHGGRHGIALRHPLGALRHAGMLELVEGEIGRRAHRGAIAPAADHTGHLLVVRDVDRVVPLVPLAINGGGHVHAPELERGGHVAGGRGGAQRTRMDHRVDVADEGSPDDLGRAAL